MTKSKCPKEFPCPVCGEMCKVCFSKKEKPYYFCDLCGVQVFIRSKSGIKRFSEFKDSDLLKAIKSTNAVSNAEVIRNSEKIKLIRAHVVRLESKKSIFGDEKIEKQIKELNNSVEKLETEQIQSLKIK